MIKKILDLFTRAVPVFLQIIVGATAAYPGVALAEEAPSSQLAGRPIIRIDVVRSNIFDTTDPKTSSWPYRWANALHITTSESFVRSMILFEVGDPWDPDLAAESARLLRSLEFLNPVYIDARAEGEGVVVTVRTHDQWTLELGANFKAQGARKEWSAEFNDKNFLGWGREVTLEYERDHERSTWVYIYSDPNVFGTRWRGRVLFADSTDGQREELLAERPFYALATRRALGFEFKHWRQVEHLYADGRQVAGGRRDFRYLNLYYGRRVGAPDGLIRRLKFGYHLDERRFDPWHWDDRPGDEFQTPDDVLINGPRISFEQLEDRYHVLRGFRGWSAQEDIAFGHSLRAGATFSLAEFGGDRRRVAFDGSWGYRNRTDGWLFMSDVWTTGRFDEGDAANVVDGFQAVLARLGPRGFQFRLRVEDAIDLDRENQLTLGADTGLRGWNPDTFDGTGRAVLNAQWRTLVKEEFLSLFSVGVVVFVDAGHTWGPRYGPGTDGVRFDAGLGLLADMTHVGLANVLRFDVAIPDDGSGPTVIVTTTALF